MVVKAFLQIKRLRAGGSLNFDFRSTFEKGSTAMFTTSFTLYGDRDRGLIYLDLRMRFI